MDYHLGNEKHDNTIEGNYRNGYGSKIVNTDNGSVEIQTSRDRNSTFDPKFNIYPKAF